MTANEAIGIFADLQRSESTLRKALRVATSSRFEGGHDIDIPVTIAFGTHDRMVTTRKMRFRDQLPAHTKWVTLPDCGHVPMYDDPELVVRTILEGIA
jgi:pimeloyl-ACP methyl ester carboxylesterase